MDAKVEESDYVFDNAHTEARNRFGALEALYDPVSVRQLEPYVVPGARCLEVGGGSGSIAQWMCERVGPGGSVVATDIDTRFLDQIRAANLEVRRHDITRDPIEGAAFDVAHTRLVLIHLPERDQAVARMARAVRPGGWLVLQEFESASLRANPAEFDGERLLPTLVAMHDHMVARGVDIQFGRKLFRMLKALGLVEVAAEAQIVMYNGGSAGAELLRANFNQVHDVLVQSGRITEAQFAADLADLNDPNLFWPGPILWTVRGRVL
jgi:SAM-dependent methyltransferase